MSAAVTSPYGAAVRAFKRQYLVEQIRAHGGNRSATARALGLEGKTIWRLMREFGITPAELGTGAAIAPGVR